MFQMLDMVFAKAKMESLDTYKRLAVDSGLVVDRSDDISDAVLPTFERWRANAQSHSSEIVSLVGEEYRVQFLCACDSLAALWAERKLGYAAPCSL